MLLYDPDQPRENCIIGFRLLKGTLHHEFHSCDRAFQYAKLNKMVLPSPTTILAHRIAQATTGGRDVFLRGLQMGEGACVSAIKRQSQAGHRVYATPESDRTVRDDLDEVRALGVQIIDHPPSDAPHLETGDIQLAALRTALAGFDVEWPAAYAVAV